MQISELSETYLLSLMQDDKNLYIELMFVEEHGKKYKVLASNKNTSPISVEFIGLTLRANLTTREDIPVLGEVESIEECASGFSIEGDMGYINVIADTWDVSIAS